MHIYTFFSIFTLSLLALSISAIPSQGDAPNKILQRQHQHAPRASDFATIDENYGINDTSPLSLTEAQKQEVYSISNGRIPGARPTIIWRNKPDGAKEDWELRFKYGPVKVLLIFFPPSQATISDQPIIKTDATINPSTLTLLTTINILNSNLGTYPGTLPYGLCVSISIASTANGSICIDIRNGVEVWIMIDVDLYPAPDADRHLDLSFFIGKLLDQEENSSDGVPDALYTAEGPPKTHSATAFLPNGAAPVMTKATAKPAGGVPMPLMQPSVELVEAE
ncbi:MAG: hypothetical protein Q9217_001571 [Psora testacea]